MTDWNYFLVNIYLSFNFLINPIYSRKEDDSATVFLNTALPYASNKNVREMVHGNKVFKSLCTPLKPEQYI